MRSWSSGRGDLIDHAQKTLHAALRGGSDGGSAGAHSHDAAGPCDPEVICLRYGTRPRRTVESRGGLSAALNTEADVWLPCDAGSSDTASPSSTRALHDFQLSCSLAPVDAPTPPVRGGAAAAPTLRPKRVRTASGIVPAL